MEKLKKGKTINLCIGNVSLLSYYFIDGFGWLRIFGIGIHWKDITRHRMYFSERNGFKKYLKIGSWHISFLPR